MSRSDIPIDHGGPRSRPYAADLAALLETSGGVAAVEEAARRMPDKVVIDDGVTQLTYRMLLDRVYGLAERLLRETADGAVLVSLVGNTAAAPVIIMACGMAGRILAPIDATHPRERQEAILRETGPSAVLIAEHDLVDDTFIPTNLPRISVNPLRPTFAARPPHRFDPERPLFIGFTSGSMGRPRGLVSSERGALLRQFIDAFHVNEKDVILGLASLSQGGSRDAFVALCSGALVRIMDMRTSGLNEILEVLDRDRVTILSFIPTALRMILGIEGVESAFKHLRVLDLHGERILKSDLELFRKKLPPDCSISITFGSMEAGSVFSWFVDGACVTEAVAPVGYILPGHQIALVDIDGASVVDGEVGEVVVKGETALGAWQGGRLTPGPFVRDEGAVRRRIFPMGDLMRRRPDGLFEFVERKDRRIKIRGLWADLGEVEAALLSIEGVLQAVAADVGDAQGEGKIGAFLVMAEEAEAPTLAAVRKAVALDTAEHMAPAIIWILEEIPRLPNFKPDLRRLRLLG